MKSNSNKKAEDKQIKEALETLSEAEAAHGLNVWLGAIIFYLINLGKVPFDQLYTKNYATRNVIVGYFLSLIIAGLFLYIGLNLIR